MKAKLSLRKTTFYLGYHSNDPCFSKELRLFKNHLFYSKGKLSLDLLKKQDGDLTPIDGMRACSIQQIPKFEQPNFVQKDI